MFGAFGGLGNGRGGAMRALLIGTMLGTGAIVPLLPAGPAMAQAAALHGFTIPAQPLSRALRSLAEQAGLQIAYETAIAMDAMAPALSGSMTTEEALRRLLAGSGLSYAFTGTNTVAVLAADSSTAGQGGALALAPITVVGTGATAWGPIDGTFAANSAAGSKTDRPIMETPQTISVVGREQMDEQGSQTVPEALRYTPGVLTERNGSDERTDFVYSRGFELEEYLDGTRIQPGTWTTAKIESFGLERIDVVKGPASVLYGQAAPGGVASLASKRPPEEELREISIEGGAFEHRQATVDLGGPVTERGNVLYRLSALVRDSGTQVDMVDERRFYIAPALTVKPNDDTDLTILAHYLNDPETGLYYKLPAVGTVLDSPNGQIPTDFHSGDPGFDKQERSQISLGYNLEHRLDDDLKLRQNARFMRMHGDYQILTVNSLAADNHTINRSAYAAEETTDTFTIDTQMEAGLETGPVDHTVLAGFDYQHLFTDRIDSFGTAPSISYLNPVYYQTIAAPAPFLANEQTKAQAGIYLEDQMKIGNVSLMLGGRHDWARSETLDELTNKITGQSDKAFTWRGGAIYNFESGFAPYASYTESFQPASGTDFSGKPFEPTTGEQVELGVKFQPPGAKSMVTLSVFDLTQQNVLTTDPAHTNFQVQEGEIASQGLELDANIAWTRQLRSQLSYAYLDNEVTKSNSGTQGRAPVYRPNHMASAWLGYDFLDGDLDGLGLGTGVRYVGTSFGNTANTLKVPAYMLMDASISYDLGKKVPSLDGMEISLNAKNLFDKVYVSGCQNNNTCYYGTRRTVTMNMTYNW